MDDQTYDVTQYERPSVTVDTVIFTLRQSELQVLLVRRKHWPHEGIWAIPGGFVHMDESLEDAARRELAEETGVDDPDIYLEQLYTFGDPGRDPRTRVITVSYFALICSDRLQLHADTDAADAAWFSAYHPPSLAFDHDDILAYAIQRLRYKVEYTAVAFQLLPETFTLTDLQEAYERILGEVLDNFLNMLIMARIYGILLEAQLSEHLARMQAMENATKNASDFIDELTLDYNKARQSTITSELIDIIGGAQVSI